LGSRAASWNIRRSSITASSAAWRGTPPIVPEEPATRETADAKTGSEDTTEAPVSSQVSGCWQISRRV
jgi:hypothetical protein